MIAVRIWTITWGGTSPLIRFRLSGVDHFEGEIPCAVEEFYGEQVNRQGVVPERGYDQQLSYQHPTEDEDEEQRENNPLRLPAQTGAFI